MSSIDSTPRPPPAPTDRRRPSRTSSTTDIAPTFGLEKIRPPRDYVGKTLRELDLQARLQLTPIALRRGDNVIVNPHRDERIGEADELVLIGRTTTSSSCASSPREMWAGLGPARAAAAPSVERRFLGQDPAATALVVGDSAAR